MRQLLDKRINTVFEQRALEIAKREDRKQFPTRVYRKFWLQSYDAQTNIFTNINPTAHLLSWRAQVFHLSTFQKEDINILVNVSPADEPLTYLNEADDGDGLSQGVLLHPINNRRHGDVVYLDGVRADIRLQTSPGSQDNVDDMNHVVIKYGFYLWRDEPNQMLIETQHPVGDLMLKRRGFGFDSKIDISTTASTDFARVKTLCKGTFAYKISSNQGNEEYVRLQRKFDKPIRLEFDDNQILGLPMNWRVYFVIGSNIPVAASYNPLKPRACVCTKLYWTERL